MPKPLRIGLLGTGLAANQLYLPALRAVRNHVQIVACANRRRPRAEAFARLLKIPKVVDTAEELIALPEVEALLISLPIELQPHYVIRALKADKPVLSEKPVGASVAQARRLINRARHASVPWLVGENCAFMDHVQKLSEWVARGRLGQVRVVEVRQMNLMNRHNPYFNTTWRKQPRHLGGFVADGGVHVANMLRRCFGTPVVTRGLVRSFDPALPPLDTVVASLSFPSGAVGTWTSCFSACYEGPVLRAFGSRANAELTFGSATLYEHGGRAIEAPSSRDSFAVEFKHFADVVQRGHELRITPEEALADLELIDRLCRGRH